MASDRARVSHDPGREYRAVIPQQGRVSLEADGNEASQIAEDTLRADIVDIVGPFGTPDDGYEVVPNGPTVMIGAGSYYLGGWRIQLAQPAVLGGFPDEVDLKPRQLPGGNYVIALLLTEHEVSAVEDRTLLEVALGGPDTCQRKRLMQRAVAIPVRGDDCSSAEAGLDQALLSQGAVHDHETGMLEPTARLQVQVVSPPVPVDPCDPPASGGYLGADNQLIRVAVAGYDARTGRGRLVWGFDNASMLYRASTADGQVLTLESDPIDSDHAPRMGQAVEVLQTRKLFDHGDVAAADSGLVTTVAQPYNPDLRTVQLAATLPAGSRGDAQHPLFLRVWQEEIPFSNGIPIDLGDTGFAVALSLNATTGSVVARPFWTFAARPSTPVIIYPRRYLDAPQPPEGPRQWLAPLAVAALGGQGATVLDDCREAFLPLTKLRPGCCGVMLHSGMGGRDLIQRALDRLRGTRGTVTLRPGRYRLRKPLRLDATHEGLTLEGCGEGVFLEAADEEDPDFAQGLVVLDEANEVTLRSLQLQMPVARLTREGLRIFALDGASVKSGTDSIGITATGCAQLSVTECQFRFRLLERQPIFAVGLMGRGECWGLNLTHNRFLHDIDYERGPDLPRTLIGYQLVPEIRMTSPLSIRQLSEAGLDTLLDDATIADNRFVGLTQAVLVKARLGFLRVERNRVWGCSGGIDLLEPVATAHRIFRRIFGDKIGHSLVPTRMLAAAMAFAAHIPARPRKQPPLDAARLRAASRQAEARARAFLASLEAEDVPAERPKAVPATDPAKVEERRLTEGFQKIAAAIEVRFGRLIPLIHVHANDVEVFGTLPERKPDGNVPAKNLVALRIVFDQRDEPSDVLVTANRFASMAYPAVQIWWPRRLVFGSNMVIGLQPRDDWALEIVADEGAKLEVMGNVVDRDCRIRPRQRPEAPSSEWFFVNRAR